MVDATYVMVTAHEQICDVCVRPEQSWKAKGLYTKCKIFQNILSRVCTYALTVVAASVKNTVERGGGVR